MRHFGSYALLATYLVVQLFGQVIHAWTGCEHAHLPGHFHAQGHSHAVAQVDLAGADGHHHCHTSTEEATNPAPGEGWHAGSHATLAIDGCLLCQHLALAQVAPTGLTATAELVAVEEVVPRSIRLATTKWLGPNSPRAPPVA